MGGNEEGRTKGDLLVANRQFLHNYAPADWAIFGFCCFYINQKC